MNEIKTKLKEKGHLVCSTWTLLCNRNGQFGNNVVVDDVFVVIGSVVGGVGVTTVVVFVDVLIIVVDIVVVVLDVVVIVVGGFSVDVAVVCGTFVDVVVSSVTVVLRSSVVVMVVILAEVEMVVEVEVGICVLFVVVASEVVWGSGVVTPPWHYQGQYYCQHNFKVTIIVIITIVLVWGYNDEPTYAFALLWIDIPMPLVVTHYSAHLEENDVQDNGDWLKGP